VLVTRKKVKRIIISQGSFSVAMDFEALIASVSIEEKRSS
jgi:hypothetical protein